MPSPILVTGGAGYIGAQTVLALAEAGYEVVVADDLSLGRAEFVLAGRLLKLDLRDRAALAELFRREPLAGVIHFAGLSQVAESMADPRRYYEVNLGGGLNLFGLAAERGLPVVFSSSAAVYGLPQRLPIPEEHPQTPLSPYGQTKRILETVLADYHRAVGLPYLSLRYFNAAGADPQGRLGEAHRPESHLIPLVLEAAVGRREVVAVYGQEHPTPDGTCVRDYVHVVDLAQAHLLALDLLLRQPAGLSLNLGTGRGHSVREVIAACGRVSGRPIPIKPAPPRPGDPPVLVADPSRAREVLGWQPRFTDLDEIVATAWAWHRKQGPG